MKSLLRTCFVVSFVLSSVLFGLKSQADTTQTRQFNFNGQSQTMGLKAVESHTEYRQEVVTKTCYRQEFVGYRQECSYRDEYVCHPVRECRVVNGVRQCWERNECRNVPRYYCYDTPEYRTVPYTCTETVSIPYEVKDFDVEATVNVVWAGAAAPAFKEPFAVELTGEKLTLKSLNSKTPFVFFVEKDWQESVAGGLKTLNVTYSLSALPVSALTVPLAAGAQDISISEDGEYIIFETPILTHPELFELGVELRKSKFLSSGDVVGEIWAPAADLLVEEGTVSTFQVSLTELGYAAEERKSGGHKAFVTLKANLDSSKVLNPEVLPKDLKIKTDGKFKL